MSMINKALEKKIRSMSDTEKLELVDSILLQLDRHDPEIDRIWAEEARHRWRMYKTGKLETVSYDKVMNKHRASWRFDF